MYVYFPLKSEKLYRKHPWIISIRWEIMIFEFWSKTTYTSGEKGTIDNSYMVTCHGILGSVAASGITRDNHANIIAADVLAPYVAKSLANMILAIQEKQVLVLQKEGNQPTVPNKY